MFILEQFLGRFKRNLLRSSLLAGDYFGFFEVLIHATPYRWCLCALRWKEAFQNNSAPMVVLEATNEKTLDVIPMEDLIAYAYKRLS